MSSIILAGVMFIFTNGGASGRPMPPAIFDDKLKSSAVCEARKAALLAKRAQIEDGLDEQVIIICVD